MSCPRILVEMSIRERLQCTYWPPQAQLIYNSTKHKQQPVSRISVTLSKNYAHHEPPKKLTLSIIKVKLALLEFPDSIS